MKCQCSNCKDKKDDEIYPFICPNCGAHNDCDVVIDGECICSICDPDIYFKQNNTLAGMMEDEFLIKPNKEKQYQCEWGGTAKFAGMTPCDSEGNEIEAIRCKDCGCGAITHVGAETLFYSCSLCGKIWSE